MMLTLNFEDGAVRPARKARQGELMEEVHVQRPGVRKSAVLGLRGLRLVGGGGRVERGVSEFGLYSHVSWR